MKKIILLLAFVFSATYLMAQNEDVIKLFLSQKQPEKAKEEVDKWLASPKLKDKEKAAAYLWKIEVYSQLAFDSTVSSKYPDADEEALNAFYQYQQLDPQLKQLKEEKFDQSVKNVSTGYAIKGNGHWKSQTWDSAFKYFSKAENVNELLLANQLETSVDTAIVLYTAFAAHNSKQYDSAKKYYAKIADLKIADSEYKSVYVFLIEYSGQQKNDADFAKYLALAKELYPNDAAAWSQYEMTNMTSSATLTDLLQKYQQDAASGGLNEDKLLAYADALSMPDKTQLEALDSIQKITVKLAAAQAYAKAFELNSANGLAAYNTGLLYYSIYSDLDDRYHEYTGESATLKAKRTEIAKVEMAYADTSAQWLEKAYPILKGKQDRTKQETQSLNITVKYLSNIYYWKRDQTKVNGNSKDYDKYDALYKQYDAEYNTFK